MCVATSYGHCLIISNGGMVLLEDLAFTMLITEHLCGLPNFLQNGTKSFLPTILTAMKKQSNGIHPSDEIFFFLLSLKLLQTCKKCR